MFGFYALLRDIYLVFVVRFSQIWFLSAIVPWKLVRAGGHEPFHGSGKGGKILI